MPDDFTLTLEKLYKVIDTFVFADDQYKRLNLKLHISAHVPMTEVFYLPKSPTQPDNTVLIHPRVRAELLATFSNIPLFNDTALAVMLACRYDQHRMKVQGWPSILSEILPPDKAMILVTSESGTNIPGAAPGDWYVWPYLSSRAAHYPIPGVRVQFYNRNLLFTGKPEERFNGYWKYYETPETS